jgi:hypothetical protein
MIMKRILFFGLMLTLATIFRANATAYAPFTTQGIFTVNGTQVIANPNANLGSFGTGSTLIFKGGVVYTENDANGNVCTATLNYILPSGTSGNTNTPFVSTYTGPAVAPTGKKWESSALNINLLAGLAPGNYSVTLYSSFTGSVTTATGCATTSSNYESPLSFKFTVLGPCNVAVTSNLTSGKPHVCILGDGLAPVTLTASGSTGYTWSPATGLSATTGASVVASPTTTTTYTVTGAGCSTSTNVTVEVFKPQGTLTATNLNPCQGTPVDFTLVGSNANRYYWSISPSTLNNGSDNPFNSGTTSSTNTRTLQTNAGNGGLNPGQYDIYVNAYDDRYNDDRNDGVTCLYSAGPLNITIRKPYVTVRPATSVICVGDVVTLTATGASTYVWSPATGLNTTTGSTVTFTATQAMAGMQLPYTVIGTDMYGCKSSATEMLDRFVSANPIITVTPTSGVICSGTETTLTASGADTYTWSPTAGLSPTTGAGVNAFPSTTTTYTVTGTKTGTGCKGTATAKVTVENVTVTITPSSTQPVCPGQSVTINSVTTGGTANSYYWSISPGTVIGGANNPQDGATTQNLVFNTTNLAPGVYTISQDILTSNNCFKGSNEIQITVKAAPFVTLRTVAKTYCVGDVVTMNASGADTYLWSPAAGLSATTGSSVTFTATSSTIPAYQVTGTNTATGCSASATLTNATTTIYPKPTVTVTPDMTVCGKDQTVISASGASTYTWSPTTGLVVSGVNGSGVVVAPTTTTTYTVTGTNANGCKNTATVKVTVDPSLGRPNQSVTYNCETKVLTIIPVEGDPRLYLYTVNGVEYESNIIGPTFGVLPANNPVIIVVKNATTGCYNTSRVTLPNCALPVRWLNTTASLNADKTVSVNWETADEVQNKGFEVERSSNGKGFERIGTSPSINTGKYQFIDNQPLLGVSYYRIKQLDIDGGFSYSRMVSVINDTGIAAFPNPTTDQLTITMPQGLTGSAQLTDINGRAIRQVSLLQIQQILKLDNTPTGTYFLTIYDDNLKVLKAQKIVKQ